MNADHLPSDVEELRELLLATHRRLELAAAIRSANAHIVLACAIEGVRARRALSRGTVTEGPGVEDRGSGIFIVGSREGYR